MLTPNRLWKFRLRELLQVSGSKIIAARSLLPVCYGGACVLLGGGAKLFRILFRLIKNVL
jgi:hypothetical protein